MLGIHAPKLRAREIPTDPVLHPLITNILNQVSFDQQIPPSMNEYRDKILLCTTRGLESEQYTPDNSLLSDQLYFDLVAYLNESPYLIFKPDLSEEEVANVRAKMESDNLSGENPVPFTYFENSKLRISKVQTALSTAAVFYNQSKDLIERLPKDSFYKLDQDRLAKIQKAVQGNWKRQRPEKISDSPTEAANPWELMYRYREEIKKYYEVAQNAVTKPEPLTLDGLVINNENIDELFELVSLDEIGDYFNVDKKIFIVQEMLIPFIRSVLVVYELYLKLQSKNVELSKVDPDQLSDMLLSTVERAKTKRK